MKVYTKTGDNGTSQVKKGRLPKSDLLFEAIGNVDELNSWLGFIDSDLRPIQEDLFEIGSILSGYSNISLQENISKLEKMIDQVTAKVPELKAFIIPSGKEQSSWFIARAVCRRAERSVVTINGDSDVIIYLNRLSDFLFMKGYEANTNSHQW